MSIETRINNSEAKVPTLKQSIREKKASTLNKINFLFNARHLAQYRKNLMKTSIYPILSIIQIFLEIQQWSLLPTH